MDFSEDFLRDLCVEKIFGSFYPFNTGSSNEVEKYIKQLVGRIKYNRHLLVDAVFDNYGSGTASFVDVSISKKDKSDTKLKTYRGTSYYRTEGLSIYISKLSPFWFMGGTWWLSNSLDEDRKSRTRSFLTPEPRGHEIDKKLWAYDISKIQRIFEEFGYTLLTQEELNKRLWFEVRIPTVLDYDGLKVFDCFFYWED